MREPTGPTWFAWCFSHGRMHNFIPCGEADSPDGAWCTADWVKLDGSTEEEALAAKTARFGDAQFIDQLPFDVQVGLYEQEWRPRRA